MFYGQYISIESPTSTTKRYSPVNLNKLIWCWKRLSLAKTKPKRSLPQIRRDLSLSKQCYSVEQWYYKKWIGKYFLKRSIKILSKSYTLEGEFQAKQRHPQTGELSEIREYTWPEGAMKIWKGTISKKVRPKQDTKLSTHKKNLKGPRCEKKKLWFLSSWTT